MGGLASGLVGAVRDPVTGVLKMTGGCAIPFATELAVDIKTAATELAVDITTAATQLAVDILTGVLKTTPWWFCLTCYSLLKRPSSSFPETEFTKTGSGGQTKAQTQTQETVFETVLRRKCRLWDGQ